MRACVRPQSRNNGWTCLCSVERTKPALPSWSNDWLRASMVGFRGGLLVCVVDFDEPCRCPRRVKQQGATGQPGNAGPGDDGGSAVFQGAPRLADRQLCGGWVVSLGRERVEERHGGPAQQRRSLTDGVFRWGHLACQRNRNTHCIARHEAGPRGAMSVPYDANIDGGKGATATGGGDSKQKHRRHRPTNTEGFGWRASPQAVDLGQAFGYGLQTVCRSVAPGRNTLGVRHTTPLPGTSVATHLNTQLSASSPRLSRCQKDTARPKN